MLLSELQNKQIHQIHMAHSMLEHFSETDISRDVLPSVWQATMLQYNVQQID